MNCLRRRRRRYRGSLCLRVHSLLFVLARRPDPGSFSQLREAQFQKCLQASQVGGRVHISAEAEIHRAVITQDSAVDGHLAADRDIGIPVQHLVAEQIERELRPGHIRTHQIEWCDRQLARDGTGKRLQRSREHADQAARQTDELGGMRALEKLRSLVDCGQQLPRVANIQRNRDRDQGDAVA